MIKVNSKTRQNKQKPSPHITAIEKIKGTHKPKLHSGCNKEGNLIIYLISEFFLYCLDLRRPRCTEGYIVSISVRFHG